MITKKQKEVLNFLNRYSKEKEYAPSLDEIRTHFKLASVSTAHYYIEKLKDKGYLEKTSNQPRSISVQSPESITNMLTKRMESFSIPILGSANAGQARLFAEQNIDGYLKVSQSLINKRDNVFALRVDGDSMNMAKIGGKNLEHGDFVLIDSEYKNPKNGDYVLSVIEGCANLKKFQRNTKSGDIKLIPESRNKKHKPIFISSEDDFAINGKIIAVLKK